MNRKLIVSELNTTGDMFGMCSDNVSLQTVLEHVSINETDAEGLFQYTHSIGKKAVYDQGKTGRCWIYAGIRCVEYRVQKKFMIKEICFSRNYIAFYDLLEKVNYFAEIMFDTIDEKIDNRLLSHFFRTPIQDAGQWAFLGNIIDKYGIVPDYAMPEKNNDKETASLIRLLSRLLRGFACDIRRDRTNRLVFENRKHTLLCAVYRLLIACFGKPPESFDYQYELTDGTYLSDCAVTPIAFKNTFLKESLNDEYISVINIPSEQIPIGKCFSVSHLGNVMGGESVKYLNLPVDIFRNLARQQLITGEPVWFGCDSHKSVCREYGILDDAIFPNQNAVIMQSPQMSKAEQLFYSENVLSHAMVLEGFNEDKTGTIRYWLVENSYGEKAGHNGFLTMSNSWFENYVYEMVIHKELLDDNQRNSYLSSPVLLEPWHPLGALAR